jgi:hypothetical protein
MALDKIYLPPSSMNVSINYSFSTGPSIQLCANTEATSIMHTSRNGNGEETASLNQPPKPWTTNETLVVLFLDAAKTSSLDGKWKRKIMSELLFKVLHARSAAEHDKFKEQHTNREAKGATASSFRTELKVLTNI